MYVCTYYWVLEVLLYQFSSWVQNIDCDFCFWVLAMAMVFNVKSFFNKYDRIIRVKSVK